MIVSVHLAWDANIDPAVTGYKLYYGKSTRNYDVVVDVGLVTDYVLTTVDESLPTFFAVTAYASLVESEYSTELVGTSVLKKVTGQPDSYVILEKGKPATVPIPSPPPDHRVSAIKVGQTWVSPASTVTIDDVQDDQRIEIVIQKTPTLTGMEY
jgi:hypothetical protein